MELLKVMLDEIKQEIRAGQEHLKKDMEANVLFNSVSFQYQDYTSSGGRTTDEGIGRKGS
jgi:hypothetical protein